MNDRYTFFNILNCGNCPIRSECPIKENNDDNHLCDFEIELYNDLMTAAEMGYTLTDFDRKLVEEIVYQLILAQRMKGEIKFKGFLTKKKIITPRGDEMEIEEPNPSIAALHLPYHRLVRMLKEMKLTPKEKDPQVKRVDIRKAIVDLTGRVDAQVSQVRKELSVGSD